MIIYTHYKKISSKVPIISAFLLTCGLQSCHDNETEPINPYSYFPMDVGQYSVYEMTEVTYAAGQKDSLLSIWQEKDEIISVSTNSSGISTNFISTSQKNKTIGNWQKGKQYTIELYPNKLVQNHDNELIIPMIFLIDKNLKWNGYEYLNLKSTDNRYGYVWPDKS